MFKGLRAMIKSSCYGSNKISSKRVIMYVMTFMAVCMIAVEASYNLALMWKCISKEVACEFHMIFDATIYGYVFGLIAALAGINGFSKQEPSEPIEKNNENE